MALVEGRVGHRRIVLLAVAIAIYISFHVAVDGRGRAFRCRAGIAGDGAPRRLSLVKESTNRGAAVDADSSMVAYCEPVGPCTKSIYSQTQGFMFGLTGVLGPIGTRNHINTQICQQCIN